MPREREIEFVTPRWKLFVEVARLGSLTRTAAVLDMQQSAISTQIGLLEGECGGRLFSRTGRGVVLTSLGESLLPRVVSLINDADQLREDIKSTSKVPSGEVRLGVVSSIAHPLVNELFRRMCEVYPDVRLQIFEGFSGNLDEWLSNGVIDIGLVHRYGRQVRAKEEKLYSGASYVVGSALPGDCFAETTPFSDLHQMPLVLPSRPSGLRLLLDQIAKRKGITIHVQMEANSLAIVKDVVAGGEYKTVLPYQAVFREVEEGVLCASKIVSPRLDRTIALATTTHRPLTFAARETAKVVRLMVQEVIALGAWTGGR